jgi:hypothetical protein
MPDLARPVATPRKYRINMESRCGHCDDIIWLQGDLPGYTYWMHMRSASVQCRMDPLPDEALTPWQLEEIRGFDLAKRAGIPWKVLV